MGKPTMAAPSQPKKTIGRPKKKREEIPQASSSKLQTPRQPSNQYEVLNYDCDLSSSEYDSEMEVISQASKRRRSKSPKQHEKQPSAPISTPKPPPLFVKDGSLAQLRNNLTSKGIDNSKYNAKFVGPQIKITATNDADFSSIKEKLISGNSKFYTHQLRSEQTTKIVLHGLYKMTEEELTEKLSELGIKPSKVKIMTIHKQKYSDHCVYLLHFPKIQKMKISTLREIKAIDQVIVRWEFFRNKRKGPIQCSNCMLYGHGSLDCYLNPVCVRCGGGHKSKECAHLAGGQKIPDELVKCGLCGQNHTANYSKCIKRIEFMQRQEKYQRNTQGRKSQRKQPQHQQQQQQQQSFGFVDAPELQNFELPKQRSYSQQIPTITRREEPAQPQESEITTDENRILMDFSFDLFKLLTQSKESFEQKMNLCKEVCYKYMIQYGSTR